MKNIVIHGQNAFINQFSTRIDTEELSEIDGKYDYEAQQWIGNGTAHKSYEKSVKYGKIVDEKTRI